MWMVLLITFFFMFTGLALSSGSWLMVWVSMEAGLMFYCPFMCSSENSCSNESGLKYYLVQVLGGVIYLISILCLLDFSWLFIFSLFLKLGVPPLYHWLPFVYSGVSYSNIYFLSTFLKIPAILLCENINYFIIIWGFILSLFIGSAGGIYVLCIKKMLSYSSIGHTGWWLLMVSSFYYWGLYFLFYCLILGAFIFKYTDYSLVRVDQVSLNKSKMEVLMLMSLSLSLAGVPPFLGFGLKWLALMKCSSSMGASILVVILVVSLSIYFYLQMFIYSVVMISSFNQKEDTLSNSMMLVVNSVGLLLLSAVVI